MAAEMLLAQVCKCDGEASSRLVMGRAALRTRRPLLFGMSRACPAAAAPSVTSVLPSSSTVGSPLTSDSIAGMISSHGLAADALVALEASVRAPSTKATCRSTG